MIVDHQEFVRQFVPKVLPKKYAPTVLPSQLHTIHRLQSHSMAAGDVGQGEEKESRHHRVLLCVCLVNICILKPVCASAHNCSENGWLFRFFALFHNCYVPITSGITMESGT